jgi:transaldolase
MKATQLLHNLGQSLWLDNITRDLLNSGTLKHYIDELSVTGLPPRVRRSRKRLKKPSGFGVPWKTHKLLTAKKL